MSEGSIESLVPSVEAHGDVERTIAIERRVATMSAAWHGEVNYLGCAAAQLDAIEHEAVEGAPSVGNSARRVAEFVSTLAEVFSWPDDLAEKCDASVIEVLAAVTPALRAHWLFREADGRPGSLGAEHLPLALIGVAFLAQRALDAGMRDITFQTITRLLNDNQQLLVMIAQLDRPMVWREEKMLDLSWGEARDQHCRYLGIVKALMPSCQRRRLVPLGNVLREYAPTDESERIFFLRTVASRLYGRVTDATEETCVATARGLAARLQRVALGALSEELLQAAVERNSRRHARAHGDIG